MANRDTLASVHAYSGESVTFPFSGAWAQADLQHIGGIFRLPLVGATRLIVMSGNMTVILFRDKRGYSLFRDKRGYSLFRDKRAVIEAG